MTTINKNLENTKIEIFRDPDFTLKSKYQHLKLWCMAHKIYKNKKILYVRLRLESFVVTGVRDLKNELFF